MTFSFGAPAFLWALPLAAAPFLLHWWGRGRPKPLRFSSIELLREASLVWFSLDRLKNWLVLACRAALVAALVLFFAEPVATRGGLGAAGTGPTRLALLLDVSYSMGARGGGRSAYDDAVLAAEGALDRLRPGDRAALVVFSDRVEKSWPLTEDHEALRRALRAAVVTQRATDIGPAAAEARRLLPDGGGVYLFSDMAAHGWSNVRPSTGGALRWVFFETGETWGNVSVEARRAEYDPSAGRLRGRAAALSWGTSSRPERPWTLWINGRTSAQGRVPVLGPENEVGFLSSPWDGEEARGELRLDPDALTLDDRWFLTASRPRAPSLLVVNGAPSLSPVGDETYYLAPVLEAWAREGAVYRLAGAGELEGDLSRWDALALLNVGALTPAARDAVARHINRGGGLWIALGDRGNPWAGTPLPARIGAAVEKEERLRGLPAAGKDISFVGDADWRQVAAHKRWELTAETGARVLVETAVSRRPVLVADDALKVWVCGFPLDRDWSNLPATALFPGMVREAFARAAGVSARPAAADSLVGESIEWSIPLAGDGAGEVRTPVGETFPLAWKNGRARFSSTEQAGFYVASLPGGSRVAAAVNADRRTGEGNLSRIGAAEAQRRLGERGDWVTPARDGRARGQGTPLAPYLGRLALWLFALEAFLLWRRRV